MNLHGQDHIETHNIGYNVKAMAPGLFVDVRIPLPNQMEALVGRLNGQPITRTPSTQSGHLRCEERTKAQWRLGCLFAPSFVDFAGIKQVPSQGFR